MVVNGKVGPASFDVISAFQKEVMKVPADGKVEPASATFRALLDAAGPKIQEQTRLPAGNGQRGRLTNLGLMRPSSRQPCPPAHVLSNLPSVSPAGTLPERPSRPRHAPESIFSSSTFFHGKRKKKARLMPERGAHRYTRAIPRSNENPVQTASRSMHDRPYEIRANRTAPTASTGRAARTKSLRNNAAIGRSIALPPWLRLSSVPVPAPRRSGGRR